MFYLLFFSCYLSLDYLSPFFFLIFLLSSFHIFLFNRFSHTSIFLKQHYYNYFVVIFVLWHDYALFKNEAQSMPPAGCSPISLPFNGETYTHLGGGFAVWIKKLVSELKVLYPRPFNCFRLFFEIWEEKYKFEFQNFLI